MSFLIREVPLSSAAFKAANSMGKVSATDEIPLYLIRAMTPSEADKGGLSVFEINSDAEAQEVAGAFAFGRESMESGQIIFLKAKKSDFVSAGLKINQTLGALRHKAVDRSHRELVVTDVQSLLTASMTFANGEWLTYQSKEAANYARGSARQNHFDYDNLSQIPFSSNWKAKNLLRFIDSKIVKVNGVPTAP